MKQHLQNAKDFISQDLKTRADRIGKGSDDMGWLTLILLFASLLAGALSALIF